MRIELKGKAGRAVIAEGATIKIIKESGMFSSAREKTLPIRNITSVEVKKPGDVWAGFIQFSIAGGIARDSSWSVTGGSFSAAGDENSVLFIDEESYKTALRIKEYVETYAEHATSGAVLSTADEIRKLKTLLDEGVLTEVEFNQKKQRLLA